MFTLKPGKLDDFVPQSKQHCDFLSDTVRKAKKTASWMRL